MTQNGAMRSTYGISTATGIPEENGGKAQAKGTKKRDAAFPKLIGFWRATHEKGTEHDDRRGRDITGRAVNL